MLSNTNLGDLLAGRTDAIQDIQYMDEDEDSHPQISRSNLPPLLLGPSSIILRASTPSTDQEKQESTVLLSPTRSSDCAAQKNKKNAKSNIIKVNPMYLHPDWKSTDEEEEEQKLVHGVQVDSAIGTEMNDEKRWKCIVGLAALGLTAITVPAIILWLRS